MRRWVAATSRPAWPSNRHARERASAHLAVGPVEKVVVMASPPSVSFKSARVRSSPSSPKKAIHLLGLRVSSARPSNPEPNAQQEQPAVSMIRVLRGRQALTTSSAARLLSTAGHMPRQARSLPLTSLWHATVRLLAPRLTSPLHAADHGEALRQGGDEVPRDPLAVRPALVRDHAAVLCQGRRVSARVRLRP